MAIVKYTKEMIDKIILDYENNRPIDDIALELDIPKRSIIAKLSSLGIYKKKEYTTKRGEIPVKKSEYVERIADLLEVNIDLLESLEKVNKNVLKLLEEALK